MSESRVFFYHSEEMIGSFGVSQVVVPRPGETLSVSGFNYICTKIEHIFRRSTVTEELIAMDTLVFVEKLRNMIFD